MNHKNCIDCINMKVKLPVKDFEFSFDDATANCIEDRGKPAMKKGYLIEKESLSLKFYGEIYSRSCNFYKKS